MPAACDPYGYAVTRQPSWPKVIGIIGIIVSAWGILSSLAGVLLGSAMEAFIKSGAKISVVDANEFVTKMNHFMRVQSAGVIILGAVLLTGSIKLLRNKGDSRWWLLAWAAGRIAFSIATIPLMKDYMDSLMNNLSKSAQAGAATSGYATGFSSLADTLGTYASAFMTSILPIFVLIWFNLGKVRAYMATWQR